MSLPQLVILWAAVAAASVVQGMVGFASGLLLTPLLILAGWTLPEAIAINLIAGVAQNLYGLWRLRGAIEWPGWLRPNILRFVALPIGVWVLTYLDRLDPTVVRQFVGAVILAVVTAFALWRVQPRERLHVGWQYLAMSMSGFFAGLCGIGGPPMVLWLTAQLWPAARARAYLFFAFSLTLIPHAMLLIWNFEERAVTSLQFGLLSLPAALFGMAVGIAVGNQLPRERLRRMMLGVLAAVAVSAIVTPLL